MPIPLPVMRCGRVCQLSLVWDRRLPVEVAASLLTAVGLPELITHNLADYEALALRLATSPLLLAQIKQKLQYREQSALFDINVQRMAFESAYKTMYQRYQLGLAPQGFSMGVEYV
jgi:protein O-GlcNAc transferase